jgi:broad specificity phosphatase PhoE
MYRRGERSSQLRTKSWVARDVLLIYFESHATSIDNEAGIASGHADPPLSSTGEQQATEISARYQSLSRVWCSDLQRSYRTGEIAFSGTVPIGRDARLRECNFGDMTRAPSVDIEAARAGYVDTPYPNGESYRDVCRRVESFLKELREPDQAHLIIGHRATWYALEHVCGGRDLYEIVSLPWRWQPGWKYHALFS